MLTGTLVAYQSPIDCPLCANHSFERGASVCYPITLLVCYISLKFLVKSFWHQSLLWEYPSMICDLLWQMAQSINMQCCSRVLYQQVIACMEQRYVLHMWWQDESSSSEIEEDCDK